MSKLNCRFVLEHEVLTLGNGLFETSFGGVVSITSRQADGEGLSHPYLEITAKRTDGSETRFCLWEDLPLVWIPEYREETLFEIRDHWLIRNVRLRAFTDENDTLTEENEITLFHGYIQGERHGEIFCFESLEDDRAMVVISENADYVTATLTARRGVVRLKNGGNGLVIGYCRVGECEKLCRDYLRKVRKYDRLVSMSNTWGDRHGNERVCLDFVCREIDTAEELGVDIVQIDDGWQVGDTNTCPRDELKRRYFDGNFWECDRVRFPEELGPVTEYARKKGIRVGMWFAPDSHDCFGHWERDMEVLCKAYREWGIRFFKLDMYWVSNDEERERMLAMLRELHALGEDVTVQMDVTRDSRLNYLCGRQYGTVFVENRYTKSGNFFPYGCLKNLWMISKYVPASRFQFELVNPDHNKDCYREGDPFAPANYGMDYLFASVMLSNPLFWMEMQFLSEERRAELAPVMAVWKEHREALATMDVCPIGEKPNGRSLTGFVVSDGEEAKYLLLFREVTDRSSAFISAPVKAAAAEILSANGEVSVEILDGAVRVEFKEPRSYAFVRIK